ncbi:prepronociceptin isoform X2 [Brachyistius frenatus]|uniref:prepronociceptin isoform X2 n=1 Tax=Brachyistius frenatus TaxID=100188 RepID=UPI0037E8B5B2
MLTSRNLHPRNPPLAPTISTPKTDGGTMKTVVALLLLCLCDPGRSDCQTDCLSCSNILPKQLSFNPMVCLIECEGKVSPSFTWDFCRNALSSPISSLGAPVRKRSQEEVEALFPEEEEQQMDGGLLLPMALQRFDHVTRALGMDERDLRGKGGTLGTAYNSQNAPPLEDEYEDEAGQEAGDADVAARGKSDAGLSVSKRFGGFIKGRHGYRKLMAPGRSYQKRYGGFIGIRKSARKWNNQKRFSEFLKQYLGMSARATEFNSVSEDLTQQNEV